MANFDFTNSVSNTETIKTIAPMPTPISVFLNKLSSSSSFLRLSLIIS